MFRALSIVCLLVLSNHALDAPRLMQCDPRWGNDMMGTQGDGERATICKEGCAMTSLTMALVGLGVKTRFIDSINPGTLNAFLKSNRLYTCAAGDCNNLVLAAPSTFTPVLRLRGEQSPPSFATMAEDIQADSAIYIAHVRNGTHFVLITDVSPETQTFEVNDPYYNSTTYHYNDIVDVIWYDIDRSRSPAPWSLSVPMFKQCDPSWGSDVMVHQTICDVGCLMSSTSMSLNYHRIAINGAAANPGTLNKWLQTHNGYVDGDDFDEESLSKLDPRVSWPSDGMHSRNDLDLTTVRSYLVQGRTIIANVLQGRHFVLATGFDYSDDDLLFVNDPGFSTTNYSMSKDVVGWRLFDMNDGY